jgi:3-dehydroquinate synthase
MSDFTSNITLSKYELVFIYDNKQIAQWLNSANYSSIFVLADNNTRKHCLPLLELPQNTTIIEIPEGEKHKNLNTCIQIWDTLLNHKADRKSLLINLGGGVVSDMGGFCAATFKRGIDFINIPTTLLAMTDATIGGKTGIDFNNTKNIIGAFASPVRVFVNTLFLKTLDKRHFTSGKAEMYKHALIALPQHAATVLNLEQNDTATLHKALTESLNIKKQITESDLYEQNVRKYLNFGHTIGHAIESFYLETNTPLLHGEAVILGMIGELWLSHTLLGFSEAAMDMHVKNLLSIFRKPLKIREHSDEILAYMANDKKNQTDSIRFVLLAQPGKPEFDIEVSKSDIEQALDYLEKMLS